EQVDAAVAQGADLVRIRGAHLVEGHRAIRRIVHPRREGERHVERADRAGDEARPVGRTGRPVVRRATRQTGSFEIHLLHDLGAERIVGLADRRRGERIGRCDVRAGREVVLVDAGDHLGPGDVQEVGVSGDVVRVVAEPLAAVGLLSAQLALDQHAPGAVEHRDSLAKDGFESLARSLHVDRSRLPARKRGNRAHERFRRLLTRSPSCLSKLSGTQRLAVHVVVIVPRSSGSPPESSVRNLPEMHSLDSPAAAREALRAVAGNLWFSWLPGVRDLFEELAPERFAALNHNPTALIAELSDEQLAQAATADYLERLERVVAAVAAEARRHTWWERRGEDDRFGVAYFSAEFGLDGSLPIYSGGLGVLAGDHLKSASDLGVPLVGLGLFYREGYFRQRLNDADLQEELYPQNDPERLPLQAEPVDTTVELADDAGTLVPVAVRAWRVQV